MTLPIFLTSIVLVLLALAVVGWRAFAPISTPPFRDADGRPVPGSIASVELWHINGMDQSVIIRGLDRRNPILVWVHGGPGTSETAVLRRFDAALEAHFVVVYWDQRYAGQNYDPFAAKPSGLTIQQYVDDLGGVVDRLRDRFGQEKVVVVGHSWGTVPGILYAQQHPERLWAYVGVSQVANVPLSERRSYDFALTQARARKMTKAIIELERLGPPPRASGMIFTPRSWLTVFGGVFHGNLTYFKLIARCLNQPEVNGRDVLAFLFAPAYYDDLVRGEFSAFSLANRPQTYHVPIFLMSGRYDQQSEASVSHDFFEQLAAPRKGFVWFDQSAHNPPFEEPAKFQAWLIDNVRPLAAR